MKRSWIILGILLFLIASTSVLIYLLTRFELKPQELLGSSTGGFESGDMSGWTNHSGPGTVEVISSLKHHGTYSANFSGQIVYWKDIGNQSYPDLYFRCYIYLYALPSSGNSLQLFAIYGTAGDQRVVVAIGWGNGVLWQWRLQAPSYEQGVPATINLHQWYCVEIERKQGVGTGAARLWVDGSLLAETTALTIDSYSRYPNIGIIHTSYLPVAVTYDCCAADTSYIGEETTETTAQTTTTQNWWDWTVYDVKATVWTGLASLVSGVLLIMFGLVEEHEPKNLEPTTTKFPPLTI